MLGMSLQAVPGASAPTSGGEPAALAVRGENDPSGPAAHVAAPSRASRAYEDEPVELPTSRARSPAALFAILAVVAAVVLAASAVGLYRTLRGGGPSLEVAVARVPEGEALDVQLPDARPGTKVRLGTVEARVEGGRARLPLAANALRVGDNDLDVEIIEPGGAISRREVRLRLDYRVRAGLGALDMTPPGLDVLVEAVPGSSVVLDGAPLALDSAGRASRRYPLDVAAARDGVLVHTVSYVVTPPGGQPSSGTLRSRLPVVTMRLDGPGNGLVTDQTEVDVAGVVEAGASVTVDGVPVEVRSGHFAVPRALPEVGVHRIEVVARSPRKLPASATVTVTRVADLAEEARRFPVEPGLGYSRIRTAPATFIGRKVMIEGRVYNVENVSGHSVVQLLARDCPRGDQCPVWVEYPTSTHIDVGSSVRVYGTVAGEQQFRSESGRMNTVPRIDAAFLVRVGG
jgi:hypothetical protein